MISKKSISRIPTEVLNEITGFVESGKKRSEDEKVLSSVQYALTNEERFRSQAMVALGREEAFKELLQILGI